MLGTPPAFVLSQDQTLHRDSERGKPLEKSESQPELTLLPAGSTPTEVDVPLSVLDVRHDEADPIEPPALAFGSRSSVFKERPNTRPRAEVPGSLWDVQDPEARHVHFHHSTEVFAADW